MNDHYTEGMSHAGKILASPILAIMLLACQAPVREQVPELILTDVNRDHPGIDQDQLSFWMEQLEGNYHRIRIVEVDPRALLDDIAQAPPLESHRLLDWRRGGTISVTPFPDQTFLISNTFIDPNNRVPDKELWGWAGQLTDTHSGHSGLFLIRDGFLASLIINPHQANEIRFKQINGEFGLIYESNWRERVSKMTPEQLREMSDDVRRYPDDADQRP